jgi:hypothetical protein
MGLLDRMGALAKRLWAVGIEGINELVWRLSCGGAEEKEARGYGG